MLSQGSAKLAGAGRKEMEGDTDCSEVEGPQMSPEAQQEAPSGPR